MKAIAGLNSLQQETVRAKPAWDATVGGALGWLSWGLGLANAVAPFSISRWLGLERSAAHVVRSLGLREILSGIGLLQNPVGPQFAWARVAGDVMDLTALHAARRRSAHPSRVNLAICVVAAITAVDLLAGARMTQLAARKGTMRIAR